MRGKPKVLWVPAWVLCVAGCAGTGEENLLRPLRDRSERGKPYQPIYVEVVGAIDTQSARDGFAKDYDGTFRLREIRQVSNAVPEECGK